MFKKTFYKAIILTSMVVLATTTSCNKFLELRPQDGVTRDKFWQTKEQLSSAVVALYTSMGGTTANFFIWGELRADMVIPGLNSLQDDINVVNNNILATNRITSWAAFYQVINLCNTVLDFAPAVIERDNTLTREQLNSYLAEALTIRSIMYFYLARTFGDVPLKLSATASDSDIAQVPKNTQAEVLNRVVADLQTAEGYAVSSYGVVASDKGRVTKFSINALQADVYLWMERYADCITACDKIITSGRFALVPDVAWFNNLFVAGNSTESIFELQFDNQFLNPFYTMFNIPLRFRAPQDIIENFWGQDDVDPINIKDVRGIDASVRQSDQYIYKYIGLSPSTVRSLDNSFAHWIFYRYADVLLMKAEACANSNRGQETLDIVSQIRTRGRALTKSSPLVPSATDVNGLNDYVLQERALELAYEGKRWYDLLRHAKRNNYARIDVLLSAVVKVIPPDAQQAALNKLRDKNNHYLPINQYELQTNPNLIQNPFYK
ncbi:RagB/SusD family nutrient uptake outer membrane protein [uncultured Mucilaginibacter sp.]|uniref:RagB/SusD family nutrient uptake outer membrane protein n=1 Tax=uncultured Mucilaginibacter sp. TaxID=797541 RepID=UPI0025D953D2|nr:RagB/SusD family nutrient uptake outer membrane protein [uncultured Mucilaginibacter sp.]